MNKKIAGLLNTQMQKEFESAYMYLFFASYFDDNGLTGFANWYKKQAKEEQSHALKFYDYLHETNQHIVFSQISAPEYNLENIMQILTLTLEHEEYITNLINAIYQEAEETHDFRTKNFLDWFIGEQREEEVQSHMLIDKYSLFCSGKDSLFALDKELGKRN